ncbi:hypothetical protein V6N13_054524 [Hibiscus sabdariffa]|uniref:Adenosylmethionine decarboxylase n=1 Tax=Hibiscus sabdariffa TaxID=183260 RepID=A0ABR2DXJ3_9ROSI
MVVLGFEGFEKRLNFYSSRDEDDPPLTTSLWPIHFDALNKVLCLVQCAVVAAVGNHPFDAYVLSESSLFVYPTKIIIKTCGTTQLLKSIRPLIHLAGDLGLTLCGCRKASVMPSKLPSYSWHVFSAGDGDRFQSGDTFTVEVCMEPFTMTGTTLSRP